ncbi:MAG: hypothetical protein KDC87_08850 [Planctomycetes bacterium]|nr:hypothetical protein [Planctomycetota bacterium]MCB9872091.1 hypothetical protein [Planctomycetota bacterium]
MADRGLATRADLQAAAAGLGFDVVGWVDAERFDVAPLAPSCGTICVLGSGGVLLWRKVAAAGSIGAPRPDYHPIEEYSARAVAELVERLARQGISARAVSPSDEPPLDFVTLAARAGLGTVSPVTRLLLHPRLGSWIGLRAALLIDGRPFGATPSAERSDDPCRGCAKPCVAACPAGVFDGAGGVDLRACAAYRHSGGCSDGCAARRACPVGVDARYPAEEEHFRHAYSEFVMRRHFELE